ncbi:MAG: DUF1549 domain-containing protein [Planctomycetaceae bacterium]
MRTAIDSFLLSEMPEGLTFADDADRQTLILRTYFDLTGLPPSEEDIRRWTAHPSGDWYSELIESLLTSERYGERLGAALAGRRRLCRFGRLLSTIPNDRGHGSIVTM